MTTEVEQRKLTEPSFDKSCMMQLKADDRHLKRLVFMLCYKNWEVDLTDFADNIIYISRDDKKYALYFYNVHIYFSPDEERAEPSWYSTGEEAFLSLYDIRDNVKDGYEPVFVLMPSVRITDYDDVEEEWDEVFCTTIEFLYLRIFTDLDLWPNATMASDIQRVGESYSAKCMSRLNTAFVVDIHAIIYCFTVEKIKDITTNNAKLLRLIEEYNDCYRHLEERGVWFGSMQSSVRSQVQDEPQTTAQNCYYWVENDVLDLQIRYRGVLDGDISCVMKREDFQDEVLRSEDWSVSGEWLKFSLKLGDIGAGAYDLYIVKDGINQHLYYVEFVDLEKDFKKNIEIGGFELFRINNDEQSFIEDDEIRKRGALSQVSWKDLAGLYLRFSCRYINESVTQIPMTLVIKNKDGDDVYESLWWSFGGGKKEVTFKKRVYELEFYIGTYTAYIKFLDETIFSYEFTVKDKDIPVMINKEQNVPFSMRELNSMVGLTRVKDEVRKLMAKVQLDSIREQRGLSSKKSQLHMAFLGNPGTGKTTVAKMLGKILKDIGVLSKGHVVVRDRSTLMNQNWGSENELVNGPLKEAEGGILFIDEAYDLVTEAKNDPGKLVISALLQAMADEEKRNLVVIFAGYTEPMERMLSVNPGLRSRLTPLYFDDYTPSELMQIADIWLNKNSYTLTPDARKLFDQVVSRAYNMRDEAFGNGRYVTNLLEKEVQPAMAERVIGCDLANAPQTLFTTIEACDIPNYYDVQDDVEESFDGLEKMVGLNELKSQIASHLSYIRFVQARRKSNIETPLPPLHMIFTGNPGTGKTSVAEYIGDIYRSIGVLSVGNVIKVSRADMVDNVVGGTEAKMKNLLTAARGNVLFIDEAYTLFVNSGKGSDFGKIAVEALLGALGKENSDMIVIVAGYPKEMEEMLSMNVGLKGRFPYTFNFEDYSEEELFEIAEGVVERNNCTMTDGAAEALKAVIRRECKKKDSSFSNARFVVRLITTEVLQRMAVRLEGETDPAKLSRIFQSDIPIERSEIKMINENLFDERAIDSALERLDKMVGLENVKAGVRQFVDFARRANRKDPAKIERYPLKWSFVGNTGTGKSSVAEILSEILRAMHLLGKGHTVEVKAEELYGVATYKADELLQKRMKESLQGLLFVDGDAPEFRAADSSYNPDHLRVRLATNTAEIHGRFAVVIAEQYSSRVGLAHSLNEIGISNFDHTLIFSDYSADELMAILSSQLGRKNLKFSKEAAAVMADYIKRLGREHANARTMKELARTIEQLHCTVSFENEIAAETIANFATVSTPSFGRIGF